MKTRMICLFALWGILLPAGETLFAQFSDMEPGEAAAAEADYQKYCSLCHGTDREGYVNDHAPSLRSRSLRARSSAARASP